MRDVAHKQAIATAEQALNKGWSEANPMTYEWGGANPHPPMSRKWFAEIDRRFFSSSVSFFAHDRKDSRPFSKFIPYESLRGKQVLEIGCGSGAHTRLLVGSGADVTAVDLTEFAVHTTTERLRVFGEKASILRMDAEHLNFADDTFDFVWSWGVIHHTADMELAINEIARVLRQGRAGPADDLPPPQPPGALGGFCAPSSTELRKMSVDDVLSHWVDGSICSFLLRGRFDQDWRLISLHGGYVICGQKHELYPIPGKGRLAGIKNFLVTKTPDFIAGPILRKWGSFIFVIATKSIQEGEASGS